MTDLQTASGQMSEFVGVGFGPANLALATAIEEIHEAAGTRLGDSVVFLDKKPEFGWHRGMLIDGATLQVSFLKDLATLRNPMSRHTFTAYLHSRGRLVEFINSKTIYPFRSEFHGYLKWIADHFDPLVRYSSEVIAIRPLAQDGTVRLLDVQTRGADGVVTSHRTQNVVIGTGLSARLPDGIVATDRLWHSSELLERTEAFRKRSPKAFAVIGAGQSAAEVVSYLHQSFPDAHVHAVHARYGYSVADDSPFANRVFDPAAVDHFFSAPSNVKERILGYHANTNYSVVDLDLSEELHGIYYREGISGARRLHLHNASVVADVAESPEDVRLTLNFLPDSTSCHIKVDAVVYATGYRPTDPLKLLRDLEPEIKKDANGRLSLARDYQVITSDSIRCGIYVHGASSEHSHGLSAGLLSNTAVRAGEIARSIVDHRLS